MKYLIKSMMVAASVLAAAGMQADVELEFFLPSKPIVAEGESNAIKVRAVNTGGSTVNSVEITITLPTGVTFSSSSATDGSYNSGSGVWDGFNLSAGEDETLTIAITHDMNTIGMTLTATAEITGPGGDPGFGDTKETSIAVQCAFIDWSDVQFNQSNGGSEVFLGNGDTYSENFASQGVNFTLDAKAHTPVLGNDFRLVEVPITNVGQTLQFRSREQFSFDGGFEPETMGAEYDGMNLSFTAITATPREYGEVELNFDKTVYPNGIAQASFFVYDVDHGDDDTDWRDALVVYGLDASGNTTVIPNVELAPADVTKIREISSSLPAAIHYSKLTTAEAPGVVGLDQDDPRGLVVYKFPQKVSTIFIRYYNQQTPIEPSAASEQYVWLSNVYRDCVSDLGLEITGGSLNAKPCELLTYTICATNDGPTIAQNVFVRGIVPAGVNFISSNPSTGSFDDGTNIWTVGDINFPNNNKETLEVTIELGPELENMNLKTTVTVFSPIVVDSNPDNDEAMVLINIGAIMQPTIARDDSATTMIDTPVTVTVLANDEACGLDPTSVTEVTPPSNGSIMIDPVTGEIKYTPNPGFHGNDSFIYQVCNISVNPSCDTARVTIHIPGPPLAYNDFKKTDKNVPVVVDVLTNDVPTDFPLDPTSVMIIVPPSNGMITGIDGSGNVTYDPNTDFVGNDSFVYKVCDTMGLCTTATAYIKIVDPGVPTNLQMISQFC